MKQLISIFLFICSTALLLSCKPKITTQAAAEEPAPVEEPAEPEPAEEPADEPAPVEEPAEKPAEPVPAPAEKPVKKKSGGLGGFLRKIFNYSDGQ